MNPNWELVALQMSLLVVFLGGPVALSWLVWNLADQGGLWTGKKLTLSNFNKPEFDEWAQAFCLLFTCLLVTLIIADVGLAVYFLNANGYLDKILETVSGWSNREKITMAFLTTTATAALLHRNNLHEFNPWRWR